jgi:hypothetical protein
MVDNRFVEIMENLVLIDSRIPAITSIISSLTDATDYYVFDHAADTLDSLKTRISSHYKCIGIAQHNPYSPHYSFLEKETPCTLFEIKYVNEHDTELVPLRDADPELTSWSEWITFLNWLRDERGMQYYDLMGCGLWSDDNWKYAITHIKSNCGINIRASFNATGAGGDFVLESDNVNMIGLYFTENILNYKYAFGIVWTTFSGPAFLSQVTYPNARNLLAVSNDGVLVACGNTGGVYQSFDFGATWATKLANYPLFAVSISPTTFGYKIASIYYNNPQSVNLFYGTNWNQNTYNNSGGTFPYPNTYDCIFMSADSNNIYATVSATNLTSPYIRRSVNGGQLGSVVEISSTSGNYFATNETQSEIAYINSLISNRLVFKTNITLPYAPLFSNPGGNPICMTSDGNTVFVGSNNSGTTVYIMKIVGTTVTSVGITDIAAPVRYVSCSADGTVVAFTNRSSAIWYSTNSGATFTKTTTTAGNAFCPQVSRDGKYIYAMTDFVGSNNFYRASVTVVGAPPVITGVYSIPNGVRFFFNKPVGGNPDPTAYYYTISGDIYDGTSNVLASTATSPITITGLTQPINYTFQLIAENAAGNTLASTFSKTPYIAPSTLPVINSVDSSFNRLVVSFTPPTDTFLPSNPTYFYSLDNGAFVTTGVSASPFQFTITNLTLAKMYSVAINAVASDASGVQWTSSNSLPVSGIPYVNGNVIIQSVVPLINGANITLTPVAGNPDTSYYQYSFDNVNYTTVTNLTIGNSFIVSNLIKPASTIYLQAVSAGNWTSGAVSSVVTPLVAPLLANVAVGSTSVRMTVRPPANAPTTYYYSVSGGIYDGTSFTAAATSPITVSGLTSGTTYRISLVANYPVGNTSATTFSVIPSSGGAIQPKYVALGYSSTYDAAVVEYSYDGTTNWSDGAITTSYPTSVFHNANLWVLGGNGASGRSSISYSSDGVSWLPATNANAIISQVNGVYYSGTAWVAVGNGIGTGANVIATSPDAVTWTGRSTTLLGGIGTSIVHRNGYWFAGGIKGTIATATVDDGSAWTAGTVGVNQSVNGFEWNGNAIVAVGQSAGTQIQYAYTAFLNPSALVWVNATVNGNVATSANTLSSALTAVSYGKGQFVAVGKSTTTYPIVYTSLYGNNWTPVALPTTITPFLNTVNYYDSWGLWTVTGNVVAGKFAAATSPDGLTWTGSAALNGKLVEGDTLTAVSPFNKIRTIYTGYKSTLPYIFVRYSFNGINWFINANPNIPTPSAQSGRSVASNGNVWVLGTTAATSSVYYSTNAMTWTASASGTTAVGGSTANVYSIAYGNGRFVAAGLTKTAYSADGITWTASTTAFNSAPSCVVFRNGQFVAGTSGTTPYIYTSSNGDVWSTGTAIGTLVDGEVVDIEWNGTTWVIVCNSTTTAGKVQIVYSTNLSTFSQAVQGVTTNPVIRSGTYTSGIFRGSLAYRDGQFVLCGYGSTTTLILTSYNGINWTYTTVLTSPPGSGSSLCIGVNDYGYTVGTYTTVANNAKYYPLITSTNGNTWIVNTSSLGATGDYGYAQGSIYTNPGTKPVLTNLIGGTGTITVVFTPSTGGDSPLTGYQYALDSPTNFFNVTNLSNDGTSFPISGLTNPSYTVYLQAVGTGWTSAYDSSLGYINVVGAAPAITGVYSVVNGLKVFFNKPIGGRPDPDAYYYTLSGDVYDGTAYYLASTATSPITITGLTAPVSYTVGLVAQNTAGNTTASSFSKAPYLAPLTAPSITQIDSSLNKLIVSFTGPTDTYLPANPVYYYSLDGDAFVDSTNTTSPLIISSGLTTAKSYTVAIQAVASDASGLIWTSSASADASGSPYIQGSDPTIQSLTANVSILNALDVTVSASTGGYPEPTNYLVATDAAFTNVLANLVAPATSTTLTGLSNQQYTVYAKAISGSAWSTGASSAVSATPFYKGTAAVAAAPVAGTLNALQLTFTTPVLGNPLANVYSYSLDNGSTYTSSAANVVVVTSLPSSSSTVYATVGNGSIWTSDSVSVAASPYYAPTSDPSINAVVSGIEQLTVYVSASAVDGNPSTSRFFCALNSTADASFVYSNVSSPVVITGVDTVGPHTVYLRSVGNLTGGSSQTTVWTSNVVSVSDVSPYVVYDPPVITTVASAFNSLTVSFDLSGGNPAPTAFYYTVSGGDFNGSAFYRAVETVSPITVNAGGAGLSKADTYTVTLKAENVAGNSLVSASATGSPFVLGQAPTITSVTSGVNRLRVEFQPPAGMNPPPTTYYYAVDSTAPTAFIDLQSTNLSFEVHDLFTAKSYSVYVKANNGIGNTSVSVAGQGQPFVIGSAPTITSALSGLNAVTLNFTAPLGGYPAPDAYYYTVSGDVFDGTTFYLANLPDLSTTSFDVSGLNAAIHYDFQLVAHNAAGNTAAATASQIPYVLSPTNPVINAIQPDIVQLSVGFTGLTGSYYPTTVRYVIRAVNGADVVTSDQNVSVTSPYDIQGVMVPSAYSVTVRANAYDGSTLVWSQVSDASLATPYVIGTAPTITAMTSALNEIRVGFAPSQGSYPPPTTYLYALDDSTVYVDANTTTSPLVIGGFTEVGTHTVRLKGRSVQDGTTIWTSLASDASSGEPYIAGLAPVITELVPGLNELQVNFLLSLNDYPQETGYEYAIQTVPGPDPSYVSVPSWTGNTFTIQDLSNTQYTVYLRAFSGNVWTSESNSRVGYPYLRGTDPSNVVVGSELNQLRVSFVPSSGGQPVATEYQYAFQNVDACFNTITDLVNGNSFSLAAPLNQVYTVYVRARGLDQANTVVAWTSNVASGSGRPYIVATTPPGIQSLTPGLNSLAVAFTAAAGGYPNSYTYQYSVDGGETYVDTTPVGSTITIGGLTEPRAYSVKLVAINTAGTSAPSSPTFSATPYVAPNVAATIVSIDSSFQALVVNFTGSSGSSPVNPTTYFYSIDDGDTYVDASSTTSPLVITSGLTTVGERSVRIKSAFRENGSIVWYAPQSEVVPGSPYIAPSAAPTVTSVDSSLNRLLVRFGASSGSYPANPSNYLYSLDGAAYQSMNTADATSVFVIDNVSTAGPHTVAVKSEYRLLAPNGTLVWQSSPSTTFTGAYAYIAGSRPNIAAITPGINQLAVRFQPSTGGYPSTSKYQYAFANVDSSFVDTPALVNGNTFVLADLGNQSYTVYLRALGPTSPSATWVSAVDSSSSRPYVVGSVPTIRSIQSGTNSLTVTVQSSTGGYPAVAGYRYRYETVSGSFQSANAFSAGNTFTLTGLSNEIYTVSVQALGNVGLQEVWTTAADVSDGRPFVVGSAPVVQSVVAGVRSLEVTFTNSVGGYPTPTIYYSVSGGTFDPNTYVDSGLTTSPIVVPGLTQAGTYHIRLKAVNAGGNSAASNALSGQPIIVVATMTVNGVTSRPNGLDVSYLLDQDPNFVPATYAYSVNSGSYVATSGNASPMAITGLNTVGTYTVQLRVSDAFGVNVFSNVARGQPYIAGAAPVLIRANSGPESLVVAYDIDAVGGYPSTTSYQYTFDGGNTYVDSSGSVSVTANPLVLPNLTENREYRVQLRSVNPGGVSPAWSNAVVGRPFVGGTAPTVLLATTDATAARLVIAPGTGAYPDIVAYEYSLDGGAYMDVAVSVDGVLRIQNLDSDTSYVVRVRGRNAEGVRSAAALVTVKTDTPARFYGLVMTPVGAIKRPIFIGPQPKPSKLGTSTNNPTESSKMRWARRRAGGRLYR